MSDRPGIIYIAVNRVNGKAYVGQTTRTIAHRFKSHMQASRRGSHHYFHRAIQKYGIESFEVAVLGECENKADLNALERSWIARLGCITPNGYNLAAGGEGSLEARRSEKWNAAVRSQSVRKKQSERARIWRASMTPEQRQAHQEKITAKAKGRPNPKLRGQNNPSCSPEVRQKISEYRKIEWQTNPKRLAKRAWKLKQIPLFGESQ